MGLLYPEGLSRELLAALDEYARDANSTPMPALMDEAREHATRARQVGARCPSVNVPLAEGILEVLESIFTSWEDIPSAHQFWLKGAIRYFTTADEDEEDFISPIGFEDDVDVLNACLRFAGRDDLCLKPEDFDHA